MRTPVLLAIFLGISMAAGACYAYRPVPVAPATGSRVRIVLTSAMPITAMAPGREDTRRAMPGVLEVTGRIGAAAGDTVAVRLGELRTAAGAVPDVADQVAFVPTAQIARIEERRFQAGTTLLAGAGLSLIVFSTFIVMLIIVVVRSAA